MGQQAGGASVHYHLLSPITRGLFSRAVSMSGELAAASKLLISLLL